MILYIIKTLWDVYFKNRQKNKPIPPTGRGYLFTEETKGDINIWSKQQFWQNYLSLAVRKQKTSQFEMLTKMEH